MDHYSIASHEDDRRTGPDDRREEHGNAQTLKAAVAALWVVVLLFAGWMWSDTQTQRIAMADEIRKVRAEQQVSTERIATLEESTRNIRESLKRIEDGVNVIRERKP